ncbi:5'-adenylylsulfate reductase-like 7 [Malania oleifera]|uniref:5'-adenylylsulfate reductase-like 7 n=1 Tax=Malania oleifera TaxID=397392 RepID=UPI0025ADC459|nr:5'-adenylylsulfate reductase-like 7 [Malania oleifera]
MVASMASVLFICICTLSLLRTAFSFSSLCPHYSTLFLSALQSQCPLATPSHSLLQVDGSFLDRALTSSRTDMYTSVLFYASWCPFSRNMHSEFEVLSFMFPKIDHLAIEQSSAMPSVFSRYGIHSLPSILMIGQGSEVRYLGPKNLVSLVQFYKQTTGLEPAQNFTENRHINLERSEKMSKQLWNWSSLTGIFMRERYLVFSVIFLYIRLLFLILPKVLSHLKDFWFSYVPHLKLEIFGETSQIMGRVLHMIDLERVRTKLRMCKVRNFHEGAKNARVWASSLASVSLGETSLAKSSS